MVKRNCVKRQFMSPVILPESNELKDLCVFPHCLDQLAKMDLNQKLINLLKNLVPVENINEIQELLKKGADPNAMDSCQNRPLHLAIIHSPDNFPLVQVLVESGAKIDSVNVHGSTPLSFSLLKKNRETTKILIKNNINLNFRCKRGWTFLMIAAMVGDLWNVRILLEHGANVHACDTENRTALTFAALGNYPEIMKELLAYGANPSFPDSAKKTVLCSYLGKGCPDLEIVKVFLLHCGSFFALERNIDASFSKTMEICLKGEPPYTCAQTVIKIQVLLPNGRQSVAEFPDWLDFADDCCLEIRFMECCSVSQTKNVKTFLLKLLEGKIPEESELERLLPMVANNTFPLYSEILRAQLHKPFCRKKFISMLLYAKKENSNEEIIFLNHDIQLKLKCYLSDDDIANFVLASYIKINSAEESYFKSLYPTGRTCSWNEITTMDTS